MNIFLHELRQYKKTTIVWALSLSLLVGFFLMLFPSYAKDTEVIRKVFEGFPLAFRKAFSIELDTFFSLFGFLSYIMTFIVLAGSVQAMNLGAGIVSKEITGKTADFLGSKPISRNRILASKICAAVLVLIITNIFFVIAAFFGANFASNNIFDLKTFFLISGTLLLTQMIFFALGFLISVSVKKIKSVISVSLPTVFAFYILSMFDSIIELDKLRYFTPFKFFDSRYIIQNGSYERRFIFIIFIFVLVSIALSFVIYNKKDIESSI